LTKVGLITDRPHQKKIIELVEHLKAKADVAIYFEEEYLLRKSAKLDFDVDIFFVKAKGDLVVDLTKHIERETSIPIFNSSEGIWLAMHRFLNILYMKKAGIPVPDYSLNPEGIPSPFPDYIVKNIVDQKVYSFTPKVEKKDGHIRVSDERALNEAVGGKEDYHYLFYQEYVESKWEYKLYGVGEEVFFFKQVPVLVNPNKMESRHEIDPVPELKEIALKAMKTLNLKLASVDFLRSKDGKFYLTDINCTPNFNYMPNGPQIVGDYIISQARK